MKHLTPLLALLLLPACAPQRADNLDPDGPLAPSGGDDPEAWFSLHSPLVVDEGQDGVWDEGERITMHFTFTNNGAEHMWYPGVIGSTDVAELTVLGAESNWWYGMFEGDSYEAQLTFEPTAAMSGGTVATLIASASSLACDDGDPQAETYCPDPNPLLVPVRLGDVLPGN